MTGRLRNAIALVLVSAGVCFVIAEVFLRTLAWTGRFGARERMKPRVQVEEPFYSDSSPVFGVWHAPDSSFRHESSCFDVTYRANEYGARDRDRTLRGDSPRIAILGDSFVEGIGVSRDERFSDILEARTGVEHLNFGTAGHFGSIQEWLLYETLASRFEHDAVYVFLLPNNDFIDNSASKFVDASRYRPYLRPSGQGDFEVYYPFPFEEIGRWKRKVRLRDLAYDHSYVIRFASHVRRVYLVARSEGRVPFVPTRYGYVGYKDREAADLEILLFTYRKLRDAADGRRLVVFSIPRYQEFLYLEDHGPDFPLPAELARFAREEPGIEYVDLLPFFVEDRARHRRSYRDYFHSCDGHWSALGHAVVADAIERTMHRWWPPPARAAARASDVQ